MPGREGDSLEHVWVQPASSWFGDEMGNGWLSSPSRSSDAVTNSWLGNPFSIENSFAGKGPGNSGGQEVKHKLALHPCDEDQLMLG